MNNRRRKKGAEIFEVIIVVNLPKLIIDINPYIYEAQITPSRMNIKTISYKQITFRLQNTKDKKKILKETREKTHLTQEKKKKKVRITADFLSETMQTNKKRVE